MGLRAKFNLVILLAFGVGFLMATLVLDHVYLAHARDEVLQNARFMMSSANAIRTYTAKDLAPMLPLELNGQYVRETVPAYAAQKHFRELQATFPDYSYREAALNPTNLANRAHDWEADMINLLRNEPTRERAGIYPAGVAGPGSAEIVVAGVGVTVARKGRSSMAAIDTRPSARQTAAHTNT